MATGWQQLLSTTQKWGVNCLLILALLSSAAAVCNRSHPYVGFSKAFTGFEHQFGGTIHIVDDCTFSVTNFTYDGGGPSVYWYGAPNAGSTSLEGELAIFRNDGDVIVGGGEVQAGSGDNISLTLKPGDSWDDIGAVALWCTEYDADFGHVQLEAARPAARAAATDIPPLRLPKPSPRYPPPPPVPPPLPNCAQLTGRYRAHWQLDNPNPARATSIHMALEARVPPNHWMGFGMNSPNLNEVLMPGSDVVVAGMAGNQGFAIDYYLNERRQCNYASGGDTGACPDNSQLNSTTDNVRMLSYRNADNVIRVEFMRPLKASDAADKRWIVTEARPITWAMGPLAETSTAALPIVLFHQINGEPVNAPLDFKLNLGKPQNDCSGPIGGSSARDVGGNVSTLANVRTFAVTTGPNPNYPNPPAWGISYHLNGDESPLIRVMRGTKYTFMVMASPQHPFYLTSSSSGGAGRVTNANETVFAGGANSFGTAAAPFMLTWTPNASTPDRLYYQCHTHQKLGWKVEVYNAGDARGSISNTTGATTTAAAATAADSSAPAPETSQAAASTAAAPPLATTMAASTPAPPPAPAPQAGSLMASPAVGHLAGPLLLALAAAAVVCG